MSPLEHSIISGASLETVNLLQSVTSNGTQLSHLRSLMRSTGSLPRVECVSNSVNSESMDKNKTESHIKNKKMKIDLVNYPHRRVSVYQRDLKRIV
eukprot:scaffold7907_cov165-Skeletonema_dohrnii-CCMP3373.AAC.4